MAAITPLSSQTAHRLSTGQVVTSVFSVVKELLENAIDAGATSVDVRLDDFGLAKIEVRDNGRGASEDDVLLMCRPHCTSKLQRLDDLRTSSWLGFRGEALAAVCASAGVSVTTRTQTETAGRLVTFDWDGHVLSQQPTARAQGTTVAVVDLFTRQPVRRRVLQSARRRRDQLRDVLTLLQATAVTRPQLRLALHHNHSQLLCKAPCETMRSAAVQVLQSDAARQMEPLSLREGQVSVELLLPGCDTPVKVSGRTSPSQCFVTINGRVVAHTPILKVLRQVYCARHGLTAAHYPVCVLRVTVPADQVDPNLEPNKTHVLLLAEESVLRLLEEGLSKFYRLNSGTAPSAMREDKTESVTPPDVVGENGGSVNSQAGPGRLDTSMASRGQQRHAADDLLREEREMCAQMASDASSERAHSRSAVPASSEAAELAAAAPGAGVVFPAPEAAARAVANTPDDGLDDSLFGDNFRGVQGLVGSESDPLVPDGFSDTDMLEPSPEELAALCQEAEAEAAQNGSKGAGTDAWTDGMLMDSQGQRIQPTELVTAYSGGRPSDWARTPVSRDCRTAAPPAAAPLPGGAGCVSTPVKRTASGSGAEFPRQPSISLWTTPTSGGEQNPHRGLPVVAPSDAHSASFSIGTHSHQPSAVGNGKAMINGNLTSAGENETLPAMNNASSGMNGIRSTAEAVKIEQSDNGSDKNRSAANEGESPPKKRPRKDLMEPEMEPIASQVVRKPTTAFVYYCRDMRRKYLSLDPDMPVGALSAALVDSWRSAAAELRRQYQLRAQQDQARYQAEVKQARLEHAIGTPPQRGTVSSARGTVMTQLRRLVAPLTPDAGSRGGASRRSAAMSASLQAVKLAVGRLEMANGSTCAGVGGGGASRLVGRLPSHGCWVVALAGRLHLLNAQRLCELATLQRLLASCRPPARQLAPPVSVLLPGLQLQTDAAGRVTDARLTGSGFSAVAAGDGQLCVAEAPCCVSQQQVAEEVAEVAAMIGREPTAPLEKCRPTRVTAWIQEEAARIARVDGACLSGEEVRALVTSVGNLDEVCCHGRPVAAPLYRLPVPGAAAAKQ